MSKSSRLFIKIILILIGMLIIGYILSISIRQNMMKQPEGSYMRLQDALLLTGAVREENREESRYIELWKLLQEDKESLLTYRQFMELVDIIITDAEDMNNIRRFFDKKYKEDFYFLQNDWYELFDEFLRAYGMEDIIAPVDITVLGVEADVAETGEDCLETGKLLAKEGIYDYQSDLFRQYKYQLIKAYKKDDTLLTVREVIGRGLSLRNVWIMEAEDKRLQVFYNNYEIWFPYEKTETSEREQVADFEFADGKLQSVKVKSDKVNGKLLSIRDGSIELEGAGKYSFKEDMKLYQLYGSLRECEINDLRIGYDFTDFVLEDGVICAALITREEAMENIRVVIKNTGFTGAYHEQLELTSDVAFTIRYGKYDELVEKHFNAGDIVTVDMDSEYLIGDRVYIEPDALTGRITLLSLERAQGIPSYRGKMEIAKTPEGLVAVNELLLEEYLYSVVPSEMPASYPLEALKAQAVCARTYAYRHMSRSGIAGFGAHVDDSAGYQVYNNIAENVQTTKAVKETAGKLLYYGEELCGAYYYSTSCGFGTDVNIWKSTGTEDTSYLQAIRIGTDAGKYDGEDMMSEETFERFITDTYASDYESNEAWYRWRYEVDTIEEAHILEILQNRYDANAKLILTKNKNGEFESKPVEKLGDIKDIYIEKRNDGGVADELIIEGTRNTFKVISEHNIRYVLNDGRSKVIRQDGSETASATLLPSAYMVIVTSKEEDIVVGYSLIGGGYGHGVGMSQNGAKEMAAKGFKSEDILTFFYRACEVKDVYQ